MFKSTLKALTIVAALAATSSAYARTYQPCMPTVKAGETPITCNEGDLGYSIVVETHVSPNIAQCQGANRIQRQTATVLVTNKKTKRTAGRAEIYDGNFAYELTNGSGTFESESFSLDLRRCVSPVR